MISEKLKELVGNSDLPQMQKNVIAGFIERTEEEKEARSADRLLIEEVAREKKLAEVILSNDEVKIYTVYGNDEWDTQYPFRSIYVNKKGTWERSNTVSPNLDLAYLVYLEHKYLGHNSRFTDFAIKMLEIKLED